MFFHDKLHIKIDKLGPRYERLKERHYTSFYIDVYEFIMGLDDLSVWDFFILLYIV